jgi:hypothetical protein
MINKLITLFLFASSLVYSQDYVDLFSINFAHSNPTNYENSTEKTSINNFETAFTLPIIQSEKYVYITGIDFNKNSVALFPNSINSLITTRLKAGINIKYSERWSGTYLFLPKIASDYITISKEDFYVGGVLLLKFKQKKNLIYKFGIYASSEAYGLFLTPIANMYYKSPNNSFEMNLTLPTDFDFNYRIASATKIGMDYIAIGKSYKLTTANVRATYAENNSLQFSVYVQNNSINKNVNMRLKTGIQINDYNVYPIDQKIDYRISALKFGDNRTQLNSKLSNSVYFMAEAIYRFDIPSK